jgi:bifunctional non-homologous end joining protein LigD
MASDWTERYPRISAAVGALRALQAVIDGEAVWCDRAGLAIFDKLHSRAYDGEVIVYAFDLLELHGEDWRPRPLEERKARLAKLLARAPVGIHYTEYLEGDGAAIFAHACRLGAEGQSRSTASTPIDPGRRRPGLRSRTRLVCCGSGRRHDGGRRAPT